MTLARWSPPAPVKWMPSPARISTFLPVPSGRYGLVLPGLVGEQRVRVDEVDPDLGRDLALDLVDLENLRVEVLVAHHRRVDPVHLPAVRGQDPHHLLGLLRVLGRERVVVDVGVVRADDEHDDLGLEHVELFGRVDSGQLMSPLMRPLPTRESYCGCTTPVAAVISPSDGPSAPASESPPIQSRIGWSGLIARCSGSDRAFVVVRSRAVGLDALGAVRERRSLGRDPQRVAEPQRGEHDEDRDARRR